MRDLFVELLHLVLEVMDLRDELVELAGFGELLFLVVLFVVVVIVDAGLRAR